jgi:hypothetical protein
MSWDDDLHATARDLGKRLEGAQINPPARRRIRHLVPVVAVGIAGAVFFALPRDPSASIERAYVDQFVDVRIDDPELRREFETALAQVERAIALAREAVRRSPQEPAFADLCHVACRAKVRLIHAYSQGGQP